MAQASPDTNVQSLASGTVASFIAALRAGFGVEAVQGGLFANLLEQVTASADRQKTAEFITPSNRLPENEDPTGSFSAKPRADSYYENVRSADSPVQRPERETQPYRPLKKDDTSDQADKATVDDNNGMKRTIDRCKAGDFASQEGKTNDAELGEGLDVLLPTDKAEIASCLAGEQSVREEGANETGGNASDEKETADADGSLSVLAQAEQTSLLFPNKFIRFERIANPDGETENGQARAAAPEGSLASQMAGSEETSNAQSKGNPGPQENIQAETSFEEAPCLADAAQSDDNGSEQAADPDLLMLKTAVRKESAGDASASVKKFDTDFFSLFASAPNAAAPASPANTATLKSVATAGVTGAGETPPPVNTAGQNGSTTTPLLAESAKPKGAYDFTSQLAAAQSSKSGPSSLLHTVEQVALLLHKRALEGSNEMTIQLRPAELGRIDIKLQFSPDNKVQGTVVVDNPATLDLLLKDVGSLQRALQDAGLRADANCLQFSLRGDNQSGFFASNGNGNPQNNSLRPEGYDFEDGNEESSTVMEGVETYYLTPGRVNLQV